MSFLKLHKLCSYFLALTGLVALLMPNELHPITWLIALSAFGISWRYERPRIEQPTYRARWTQVTVGGVLLAILLGVTGIFPNPILLGAYLIILLQINKLFNRTESKDYLHLYILSFLMLTLGTIINTDISFAICFVLYVIFITWTLTLFHLRREIEETYLMRHSEEYSEGEKVDVSQILQSRRLIRGSFLFSTSLIALLIFLMSSVIFFLFPRIGFGLFFQRKRSGIRTSGFSNEVKLGSFRRIQINRKVVMRVEFPWRDKSKKPAFRLPYYWRGSAYDFYDGASWKRSRRYHAMVRLWAPDRYQIAKIPARMKKRVIKQIIYQEPLDVPILFGIDQVFEVRIPMTIPGMVRRFVPRVRVDIFSDTLTSRRYGAQSSSVRYIVKSVPHDLRPLQNRRRGFKRFLNQLFLQLPKDLNPKIPALARQITQGRKSREAKARAVIDYLNKNYKYSLSRQAFTGPPLDDFLFKQKLGHCEFFSTALAILLRSVGVPARQVTGFYGATWNDYGKYYAVRQSDAHSWAEIYVEGKGWKRFDASPRSVPSQGNELLRTLEAYFDSLRLRWYKWIIEYDLIHQINALKALRSKMSFASQSISNYSSTQKARNTLRKGLLWGGLLLLFGLVGVALWWRSKKRGAHAVLTYPAVSQLYLQGVALLQEFGFPREESETPNEYLQRLLEAHPALGGPMGTLTEVYLQLRYNPLAASEYRMDMLTQALGELRRGIQPDTTEPS